MYKGRVFANSPGSIPCPIILKTKKKMSLHTFFFNANHNNVWIKGKVDQSKERSTALPYTSVW